MVNSVKTNVDTRDNINKRWFETEANALLVRDGPITDVTAKELTEIDILVYRIRLLFYPSTRANLNDVNVFGNCVVTPRRRLLSLLIDFFFIY